MPDFLDRMPVSLFRDQQHKQERARIIGIFQLKSRAVGNSISVSSMVGKRPAGGCGGFLSTYREAGIPASHRPSSKLIQNRLLRARNSASIGPFLYIGYPDNTRCLPRKSMQASNRLALWIFTRHQNSGGGVVYPVDVFTFLDSRRHMNKLVYRPGSLPGEFPYLVA